MLSATPLSKLLVAFILCTFREGWNIVQGEYKCPQDWILQGPNCFFINSTRATTWHQAVQKCIEKNATLAKITNEDESKFIGQKLRGDAWIGIHDEIGDESFTWLDEGVPLNFTYWATGEPNNASENCVSLYGYSTNKGSWSDFFCRTMRRFICEKPTDATGCPDKWRVFAGRCYYFSNDSQTWFDARKQCQNYTSSDLVVVENELENNFVKGAISRGNYWIGLNDRKEEGVFRWNDQDSVPNFFKWNFGEPNNAGNVPQDCATMLPQSYRRGKWSAAFCKSYYGYVCEKPKSGDCEDGWTSPGASSPNGTSCYMSVRNMTDWATARKLCQQGGGDLLVVDSLIEQNYVKTIFFTQSWIGLNDLKKTGQWTWLDSSDPVSYSLSASGPATGKFKNWYRNEPSSRMLKNINCVLAHAGAHNVGRWANVDCALNAGYVCEVSSGPCTGQWMEHNGHCYSFNIDLTSWTEALPRCQLQNPNAYLAIIEQQAEQDFITQNMKGKSNLPGFWIALNSRDQRGVYKWGNSTTSLSYTNWAPRAPSLFMQEACIALYATGYNRQGRWSDVDCMQQRGYVCQLPAEGDSSYFDFSLNGSVYKIVRQKFSKDAGQMFCAENMGSNATLLHLDSEEEYDAVNGELLLRFSSYSTQFWVDGDAQGNDSFTVFADEPSRYPSVSRDGSEPGDLGRRCLMITPRSGARPYISATVNRQYAYKMYARTCCEEKMIVCEKKLDKETSVGYNFEFNDSLYKVIASRTASAPAADAVCRTIGVFYGSGRLVQIDSLDELMALSTELKVRHLGSQFEYLVGGDPTKNLTYDKLLREPQTGENCLMLTHKGFPNIPWHTRTLDLAPTKCDNTKEFKFICELKLYLGGPKFAPSKQDPNAPPESGPEEPKELILGPGCVGPCIGLAVAFPFAIILAVAITAGVCIYWKKRDHFGFSFHKASDEVYLTA